MKQVFIGSSMEQQGLAMAVQGNLHFRVEPTVWTQGVFRPSRTPIESLCQQLDKSDAGIFILAPDDIVTIRSKTSSVARDNVLFELGLFIGRLGRERTFLIVPDNAVDLHLPTDIIGISQAKYNPNRSDGNLSAAMGPACDTILMELNRLPERQATSAPRNQNQPRQSAELSELSLSAFLQQTPIDKITEISVCAYTGSTTVRTLCNFLERTKGNQQKVRLNILLHSPLLSDKKRADDVQRTVATVKVLASTTPWILPTIRYYSAPPLLRSVMFDDIDGKSSAYLAYYDWQRPDMSIRRPTANEKAAFVARDGGMSVLFSVHRSWFQHFWGQRPIHTLIFDFDDTLFFTTVPRAKAWADTIQQFIADKLISDDDLSEELRNAIKIGNLEAKIVQIILEAQEETSVARRLFAAHFAGRRLEAIVAERIRMRRLETERSATPIPNVVACLEELAKRYQLVIVTATSESLVQRVLEKHGISGFSFVFGSEAPLYTWDSIYLKSQSLLRVSSLLGVPLERMIFVGDSNSDYQSARQLGLHFIENRMNARRFGRQTIIAQDASGEASFIDGTSGESELQDVILKIENAVRSPLA